MKCPFSIGDKVKINESAEVAHEYIGQRAVIVNCALMGTGTRELPKKTRYNNFCLATIQFENDEILKDVPSSELSSLQTA